MKKHIPKIILLFIVILLGGYLTTKFYGNKVKFNDTFVNGNTASNLYNAGLFCEKNGKVYFSNPDDEGKLYVMDPDFKNMSKLCDDKVMYINADDNYVYYVRNNETNKTTKDYPYFSFNNNSLCRIDKDGKNIKILDEKPCIYAALSGNYIYYLHYDTATATTLYKVKIDGTEKKQVLPYYVFNCSMINQYFYFSGTQSDGDLYKFDTTSDSYSTLYGCCCFKPVATDSSNFYYTDYEDNFKLKHLNLDYQTETILTEDSVDLFNIYGSTIFYQRFNSTASALCMMKTDGSGQEELALGTYHNINVTSTYVYFQNYNTGEIFYTSTSNPGMLVSFHPGIDSK